VVNITREKDPEVLRQVALLLDRENQRLHARLKCLATELSHLKGDPGPLQLELIKLQELLAQREKALFGASSERRANPKRDEKLQDPEPQRGHGPKEQPSLPVVEQTFELDDADKTCPKCGGVLAEMKGQFEEAKEVDVVERHFVMRKILRKKYRCACNACVETALGPDKLIPGGHYSVEFAIEVATSKYLDHVPLERQSRIMAREGLKVDSQTLWDQIEALARKVAPLHEQLQQYVLSKPVIGADETHWLMLTKKGKPEENRRWWIWSAACDDAVVHRLYDTRSHEAAQALLGSYAGIVITDGYAVYESLKKRGGRFRQANCWAHVRRKFGDAEQFYPQVAGGFLALIDQLFVVENEANTGPPDDPGRIELLRKLREERSRPIVDALNYWAMHEKVLPESALGKALKYMADLWPGLVLFLENPHVPLTNNGTERSLRGPVIGRKNHYGSKSRRGTEVAALFYSIFESAKLAGIEPKFYLRRAVRSALRGEALLMPHEVAADLLTPAPTEDTPPASA